MPREHAGARLGGMLIALVDDSALRAQPPARGNRASRMRSRRSTIPTRGDPHPENPRRSSLLTPARSSNDGWYPARMVASADPRPGYDEPSQHLADWSELFDELVERMVKFKQRAPRSAVLNEHDRARLVREVPELATLDREIEAHAAKIAARARFARRLGVALPLRILLTIRARPMTSAFSARSPPSERGTADSTVHGRRTADRCRPMSRFSSRPVEQRSRAARRRPPALRRQQPH